MTPPPVARLRAFVELGKLRLASLAIFAVVAGLWLGSGVAPPLDLALACVVGTLMVAAGGNALNMYLEREADRHMARTHRRPLPSGRLRPAEVLVFGVATVVVGLAVLAVFTNLLATLLCTVIVVTYVLVYTPLKRQTAWNTLVGAIPGGLPPVVGYAAATGVVDGRAAVLFLILFFWQVPHFLAIAWRYREEYRKGGMKMLPVLDQAGDTTALQMVVYTLALVAASLMAHAVGLAGPLYLLAAFLLGIAFLVPVVVAAVFRWDTAMRACFFASVLYLPLLLIVMLLDRGVR